ncbi:MAG: MATE family efflux transporter [Prevotella sp.]|nr:MATE family efflux transporter [Candidatus Prevotella equi]
MSNKKAALELGTKPVGALLVQYAMPAIIAMVASSLYNMIDSIFIGQGVGPMAISGLAVTFPFMNLSAAFGAAIGIGSSTFLSVKLGQRDYEIANRILGNNVMLNIVVGIIFGGLCLLFLDPILRFFGASDQTLPYAREYMVIILLGNAFTHLYFGLNAVLRSAGKPKFAMYTTVFTVVLNAILDPIFIYALNLGIAGAAYATVLSQFTALCWQWYLFSKKEELLHFEYDKFRIEAPIVRNIVSIGISPFCMNACGCLVVLFINNSLLLYGDDITVGAYGISNRVAFVFVMVTLGVCQGMQPIAGYNYGAQNYNRMLEVLKLASISGTAVCAVGFFIAMFLPRQCMRLFTTDPTMIEQGIVALRYNMMFFLIIGAQMVITNFFQSIGKAKISIFLSLSRQLLILIPMIYIFPKFWGLEGVWISLPASDAIAAIMAYVMLWVYVRQIKVNA